MLVYTSVSNNYIPKARVLARSLKKFHSDWHFVLVLCDKPPKSFDLAKEPFDEILTIENIGLPNMKSWAFGHSVVELCTAVKGPAAEIFISRPKVDKVMYLDPDIKVFSSLKNLENLLDEKDILLTPHLLEAETEVAAILDNEVCALKHGVFNLGFFAVKCSGQGIDFVKWWSSRLREYCIDDIANGFFTDQKWCDLAPVFFSKLAIVRDTGCNVATWNIAHRPISLTPSGEYRAGPSNLRFYHFTGYDSGVGYQMLKKYASSQKLAKQLWTDYKNDLEKNSVDYDDLARWYYGFYDNGVEITREARLFYRSSPNIHNKFPDPYSIEFLDFWKKSDNRSSSFFYFMCKRIGSVISSAMNINRYWYRK